MNAYETTATVEDQGQVHLAGVPFGPGTEVAVTIREKLVIVLRTRLVRMKHLSA
jgi:hypothetical protein